jgi:hypothetical protein
MRKRKAKQMRTALSQRNIIEFGMEQSIKVQRRNRSLRSKVLRTDPSLLQMVHVFPPPEKEKQ